MKGKWLLLLLYQIPLGADYCCGDSSRGDDDSWQCQSKQIKTNMQTRANLLQSSHHRITLKFTMRCRRLMKCDWGLMTGDVLMSRNVAVGWRGAKELKSFSQGWVIFLLSAAVQPWSCNETHPISVPLELRMRPNSTRRQMRMSNRSRPMYPSHLGGQLTN